MTTQPHATDEPALRCSLEIEIRHPTVRDAAAIWRLVRRCGVLDQNSLYAYLLVCRDFAATSLVAMRGGELVGVVIGFVPPPRPDVIFVWQIGIDASARGRGLAKALLERLRLADACREARFMEATITPSNTASRRLFQSMARKWRGDFQTVPGFVAEDFGDSEHEPEDVIRITFDRRSKES